jgi:hypothetical protein
VRDEEVWLSFVTETRTVFPESPGTLARACGCAFATNTKQTIAIKTNVILFIVSFAHLYPIEHRF